MGLRRRDIAELYERRYVGFRNALAAVTGSYDSAADLVQEAFAVALRSRRSFRGDGAPEAWVWKIALRLALREQQRQRRNESADESPLGGLHADLPEPDRDPAVATAIRSLPPRRRLIVFLHYFADLPYAQIAEICEVSEGTVAATLAQARDAVRAALSTTDEVEHDLRR